MSALDDILARSHEDCREPGCPGCLAVAERDRYREALRRIRVTYLAFPAADPVDTRDKMARIAREALESDQGAS